MLIIVVQLRITLGHANFRSPFGIKLIPGLVRDSSNFIVLVASPTSKRTTLEGPKPNHYPLQLG